MFSLFLGEITTLPCETSNIVGWKEADLNLPDTHLYLPGHQPAVAYSLAHSR